MTYTDQFDAQFIESPGSPLDPGIARFVKILAGNGVETFESCQGGEGHCSAEPFVRFHGGPAAGPHALSVAMKFGLPVLDLRRCWSLQDGEPTGPVWELTFREWANGKRAILWWNEPHIDWRATAAAAQSRLHEAERERDEARAAIVACQNERDRQLCLRQDAVTERDQERRKLDTITSDLRSLCEVGVDATLHCDEARDVRAMIRSIAAGAKEEIAKLERELAEARDMAEFRKGELGRWMQRYDEQAATIARMKLALTGSEDDKNRPPTAK